MHELTCPSCNKPSQYIFSDYLLMCPFCSATFKFDVTNGQKELFGDQFPASTLMKISELAAPEWLVEIEAYAVI